MQRQTLQPEYFPFLDYRRFTFSLGVVADSGVWLSGCTAVRYDAQRQQMVVDGGLEEQASVILEKMRLCLASCGKGLDSITRIVRYVTPDVLPKLQILDALQAGLVGQRAASSTIVVNRLLRQTAMIEMEAFVRGNSEIKYLPTAIGATAAEASRQLHASLEKCETGASVVRLAQFMTAKEQSQPVLDSPSTMTVLSPCLPNGGSGVQVEAAAAIGQSAGVVFAAAQGDPKFSTMEDQCRDVYNRIERALAAQNSSFDHVLKTTEFITPEGLASYKNTAAIRRQAFTDPYPAATGVICEGLPQKGSLIAMEVVAGVERS